MGTELQKSLEAGGKLVPRNNAVVCNSGLTLAGLLLSAGEHLFPKKKNPGFKIKIQSLSVLVSVRVMLVSLQAITRPSLKTSA